VGFEQAAIPVEKEKEFAELRSAIEAVFVLARVEKFFAALKSKSVRIRDFESVLAKKILESAAPELKQSGFNGQALYRALTVSDQGQMREFYLQRVEQVPSELRHKFHYVYRDS
jgi:hypothetical protein